MKNYLKSLMFAVVSTFILSSCDDVPSPYPMPINEGDNPAAIVEPAGEGTLESPYNVAYVRQICGDLEQTTDNSDKKLSPEIYVKGIVSKVETDGKNAWSSQYGNITYYISDDGKSANEFEVYRGLGLDGAKFASQDGVNVGDEVVVCGKVLNFKGTYEFDQGSKLVSINGSGDTPTPTPTDLTGDGTKDKPYTATEVFTVYNGGQTPTGVWIKGFIVGYVEGQKLAEGAHFNAEGNVVASNILLAASADETDYNNCVVVQLPVGDVRTRINLKDHSENLKAEVSLCGDIAKYFGVAGLKNTTKYVIGTETNDNGDDNSGDDNGDSSVEQVFTSGLGSWSIADVELGGLTYVWQQSTSYGMKASAFSSNTAKAAESWFISPAFTVGEKKTLSFNNCLNYLKGATLTDHIAVMVSTDYSTGLPSTATWTSLDFAPKPDGSSWNWVDSKVDLSAYANQSIHIAFKYVSNTTTAPTWEIKKVSLE